MRLANPAIGRVAHRYQCLHRARCTNRRRPSCPLAMHCAQHAEDAATALAAELRLWRVLWPGPRTVIASATDAVPSPQRIPNVACAFRPPCFVACHSLSCPFRARTIYIRDAKPIPGGLPRLLCHRLCSPLLPLKPAQGRVSRGRLRHLPAHSRRPPKTRRRHADHTLDRIRNPNRHVRTVARRRPRRLHVSGPLLEIYLRQG